MTVPSDISKYRQALMGIAIIGVMATHWCGFQSIHSGTLYRFFSLIGKLVFTEGLLFLSGFGLYYSFSKDPKISLFYRKRFNRLYLPFVILSLPLYLYFLFADSDYTIITLINQLTTFYFWISGNYGGMWYVAISIFMYLLFPLLYRFLFSSSKHCGIVVKTLLLILFVTIINVLLFIFDDQYYDKVAIGVTKIPMFIVGILFGYEVKNKRLSVKNYLFILLFFLSLYVVLSFFKDQMWVMISIGMLQKFVFMPAICLVINLFDGHKIQEMVVNFLNWFGKYSLELYILHLHIFMFLDKGFLSAHIPMLYKATCSIILAIVLCVPVNKGLSRVINYTISKNHENTFYHKG